MVPDTPDTFRKGECLLEAVAVALSGLIALTLLATPPSEPTACIAHPSSSSAREDDAFLPPRPVRPGQDELLRHMLLHD